MLRRRESRFVSPTGQMYLEQGDFARARENADMALRSRRADPTAWALKADVHRCCGQLDDAISCYQRAMVYRPDWPEVQVTVADLYRFRIGRSAHWPHWIE